MAPDSNAFRAAFALGDKAVKAAPQSKLPQRALKMIKEAKKYPEGTAVRIEVKKESEPPPILTLAAIKLEN